MSESPSCYPAANAVYTWAPPPPPTPVQCDYTFSYSTATAYSPLPVSGPTTLATGTTADAFRYGIWPNQPLGFTFVYNGQNYTEIGVCAKGYIWFGNNNPTGGGTPSLSPSLTVMNTTANIDGIIAGLNADWVGRSFSTNTTGGAGGAIRTNLTGTAPNRVFIIEWSNVRPNGAADGTSGNPNLRRTDFQILLYETSNKIEVAFNINPYPYSSFSQTYQCGLRGTSNTNTHTRQVGTGGGAAWAASSLGTSTSTVAVDVATNTYPPTNARFIFTPSGAPVTCTWNGSTSSDWHTASNWTPSIVPTTCNNVVVPVIGSGVYPQIGASNDNAFCRSLTINSGASLTLLNTYTGILRVYGNLINNGTIAVNGNNPIYLTGGIDNTISGSGNNLLAKYLITEASTYKLTSNLTGSTTSVNTLNIASGSTLNLNGYDLTVYSMVQTGTLKQSSGMLSIEGPTAAYTLTAANFQAETGTTYFASGNTWSAANQIVPSLTYNNLKIRTNNGFTVTLGSTADFICNDIEIHNPGTAGGIVTTARHINATGNLSIGELPDAGVHFSINHCIYRTSGTGTFTMGNSNDNNITINKATSFGPYAAALTGYGSLTFYGTVTYVSPNSQTVMSATYHNISVSGGAGTRSLNGPIVVTNNLTISDGALNATPSGYAISVAGNWTNTATFMPATGTVTFNGTGTQIIQAGSSAFYKLNIDAVDIQLSSDDVQINNQLILTNGIITTNSQKVVISPTAANAVIPGVGNTNYLNSWINGVIRRYINNTGAYDYDFPVGNDNASHYGKIITNDLEDLTYIDAWFRTLDNHDDNDLSLNETGIMGSPGPRAYYAVNPAGCWVFEPDVQPTSGTYNIQLSIISFSGLQNNQFGIVKRPENSTTAADWNTGGGQLNPDNGAGRLVADGYALRLNLNTFSEFGIGQFNGNPLPVVLTDFRGTTEVEGNKLSWITLSEMNSDYYAVEHSKDGIYFSEIGTIAAKGFSSDRTTYNYLDEARSGINYYRLKCVDIDKSYRYSNVIALERNPAAVSNITLYPNPASGLLHLEYYTVTTALAQINIYDMNGKRCIQQFIPCQKGNNSIKIQVSDLASATYLVEVCIGSERHIRPFIKE